MNAKFKRLRPHALLPRYLTDGAATSTDHAIL
jgi:hypothetical protein